MIIIVGLGNPGAKYAGSKHNLGFITVDQLAERHGIRVSRLRHKALVGEGLIAGQKVMLVKPQTWMNDSGLSVQSVVQYYGASMEELFVIYDDVDIPLGTLRIRKKGSAGSHNGMRNIIYLLEDDGFPRFRLGIGAERGQDSLRDYVLTGFTKEQLEPMRDAVIRCVDAIELALSEGIEAAMLRYNLREKGAEVQPEGKGRRWGGREPIDGGKPDSGRKRKGLR